MYECAGVRQTFFMPGWCVENYPDMARSIVAGGHEIAAHGYLHEFAHGLSPEEERALLTRTLEAFERVVGVRPRGWRGPMYTFSDVTGELLAEHGFEYDSSLMGDDAPYLLDVGAGEIVELPVDVANDDGFQYMNVIDLDYISPQRAPARAMEVYRAEFAAMHAIGGLWVAVLHPFASARPSRAAELEKLVVELSERDDVWLAPLGEIAAHVREVQERSGSVRVERLPFYTGPLELP
jgi:peptidoglycan/xylan/chitin deacetylase (PgdA/CDA1 family)